MRSSILGTRQTKCLDTGWIICDDPEFTQSQNQVCPSGWGLTWLIRLGVRQTKCLDTGWIICDDPAYTQRQNQMCHSADGIICDDPFGVSCKQNALIRFAYLHLYISLCLERAQSLLQNKNAALLRHFVCGEGGIRTLGTV